MRIGLRMLCRCISMNKNVLFGRGVGLRTVRPFHAQLNLRALETANSSNTANENRNVNEEESTDMGIPQEKKQLTKEQLKKRELRKFLKEKIRARLPANTDPLYMNIADALRVLRAVEVGQPESQQIVTLNTRLINEKGVAPLSGDIQFPHPLKATNIIAFSNNADILASVEPYCIATGGADLISKIIEGELPVTSFDKSFATPDIVAMLNSQLGKLLGRRGLLPNVKKGTVSDDPLATIKANVGKVPFRQRGNGPGTFVNVSVGKCTMSDREILENIVATRKAIMESMKVQKSKAAKRHQVSILARSTLTTTHGPGITIDFA